MTDLTSTIAPKSDQLNADDLIGNARTITVASVKLRGEPDQPIAIGFEGDGGKPYLPCKSMRRVLVSVWGGDGNAYVGRRMTLYRDDKVQFGGMAVGGIRISHMSDITRDVTLALTATRASRKPYTVKPMPNGGAAPARASQGDADMASKPVDIEQMMRTGDAAAGLGLEKLQAFWQARSKDEKVALGGKAKLDAWKTIAEQSDKDLDDDTFPGDIPMARSAEASAA